MRRSLWQGAADAGGVSLSKMIFGQIARRSLIRPLACATIHKLVAVIRAAPCNPTAPGLAPRFARLFFACSDLITTC